MSRPALLLALLALLVAPARANEDPPEAHAFLEVATPRARLFVGEPFALSLRIGIDRAFFDEHAAKLFRRPLGLPVQVEASWLAAPPGTRALEATSPPGDVRLALGGREARAASLGTQRRGGRDFDVVEVSRRYLPEAVGTHLLDATLRFAYAARFEEDFFGVRVAVDRRDVFVRAEPFKLEILPLPADGRPGIFDGAVGLYTVTADLAPAPAGPAGNLVWTLVIEGEGNLAFVAPPAPERLVGFHVYGLVDDHGSPRRTVVYEIAPQPGTAAVPAVPFAFFDPTPPAGYRVVRTASIPLERPTTVAPPADEAEPQAGAPWAWLLGLTGLVLAGVAFVRLRRVRRARAEAPAPPTPWAARLAEPGVEAVDLLTDTLAAHLGVPPAAVIGPDLGARLVAAGVEADLAARTARTLEALVGARFGGGAVDGGAAVAVADVLTALEIAFAPHDEHGGAPSS